MRGYILLALVGLAFASIDTSQEWERYNQLERDAYENRDIKHRRWEDNKEFRFYYDGQVLNGFPHSSRQHSGSRIQCMVVIQQSSQNKMHMKLENVRMGRLNRKIVDPRRNLPFQTFEPISLETEFKTNIERPCSFEQRDGMIRQIHFEEQDSEISKNMKRGILNLLQVNLKQHGSMENTERLMSNSVAPASQESKFFRVMEPTVEGECETLYTVNKLPSRMNRINERSSEQLQDEEIDGLNVTKSINFDNCNRRPRVMYNYRNTADCETCDDTYQQSDRFVKSSSVIKYNLMGDRNEFLIENVRANSQHSVEIYSDAKSIIEVYVNQRLHLVKTGEMSQPLKLTNPVRSDSEVVYSQQWDLLKEKFYSHSEESRKESHKPANFVQHLSNLIKSLAQTVSENNEQPIPIKATSEFSLLVSALRKANKQELEQIHQKFMTPKSSELSKKEKKVVQDILESAVGAAGTETCVKHLAEKIEKRDIRTPVAISALRQLVNARVVSRRMVNKVKELCECATVQEHASLKRNCYLTLGSLMKSACETSKDERAMFKEERSSSETCSVADKNEFVQFLINKMESAQKWEDKILYLKSLSNAALDVSVIELEKIILNQEKLYPTHVRYEAALALRHLLTKMPHKIQKILMPVFMNPREPVSLRQLCSYLIINSRPQRAVLDKMAKQIDVEPNRQVAIFTHEFMSEMSNSTNPCEQRLAKDLKLSLRLSKRIPSGILDSKVSRTNFHSILRKIGMDVTLFDLMGSKSMIPKFIGAGLDTNMLGSFTKNRLFAGLKTEHLAQLIPQMWSQEGSYEFDRLLNRHPRSVNTYAQSLKQMFQKLKISPRDNQERTPKVYSYWRMNGQETGFMPINKELIDYLMESEYLSRSSLERLMTSSEEKHVSWHHATMMADSQMKLPTLVGLPLIIKHKSPVVMKVEGTIKSEGSLSNPLVKLNLKPSIAMKMEETIEVWNPITPSGVRVRSQLKAQLPVNAKVHVNVPKRELRLVMLTPTVSKTLLDVETEPITFVREPMTQIQVTKQAEEKVVFAEEINRQQLSNSMTDILGLRFNIISRYAPYSAQISESKPMCPLSGPTKFVIRCEPSEDNTKEVELKINLSGARKINEPVRSDILKSQWQEDSESQSQSSEEVDREFSSTHSRFGEVIVELKNSGSSRPAHYKLEVRATGSIKGRFGKLIAKLSRQSDKPYEMCLKSEVLYATTPYDAESVQRNKFSHQTELRWGQTCQANNFIQISSASERTREQLEREQENSEAYRECKENGEESPITCYEYIKDASHLNKHTITIKYNNVPVYVQNMTTSLLRSAKNSYYYSTDIASINVRNPANIVKAIVRFDAKDRKRVNITIESPKETVKMIDIEVPSMPRLSTKRSFVKSISEQMFSDETREMNPVCKAQSGYVQTFDGRRYRSELSDCFSVLAKDCSERQRFVVLAKKESQDSNKKVIKVITHQDKLIVKKEGDQFKVESKDGQYTVSEESSAEFYEPESQRCQMRGEYIMCRFPEAGMKLYFDGYSANIKVSPMLSNQLCGLCGHMNGNGEDDFQSPEFEPRSDLRRFQQEYILKDSECTSEVPELETFCEDEECRFRSNKRWESNSNSQEEERSNELSERTMRPRQMTKTIQKGEKICFSKTPVVVCEEGSYPVQASREEIEFCCLDKSDSQTLEWQERAERSVIPETRSKPTAFTRTEIMPATCKPNRSERRFSSREW